MRFYQVDPQLENYWRGIILFGNNFATYKFALAHALYDVDKQHEIIRLEDLALPFSKHICQHLHLSPKQILRAGEPGKFLGACLQSNQGEITSEQLQQATVRYGFSAVLDAFHTVNGEPIGKRFFLDERRAHQGIRLTDEFYRLMESVQFSSLEAQGEVIL